jgi:hypothetical protein
LVNGNGNGGRIEQDGLCFIDGDFGFGFCFGLWITKL